MYVLICWIMFAFFCNIYLTIVGQIHVMSVWQPVLCFIFVCLANSLEICFSLNMFLCLPVCICVYIVCLPISVSLSVSLQTMFSTCFTKHHYRLIGGGKRCTWSDLQISCILDLSIVSEIFKLNVAQILSHIWFYCVSLLAHCWLHIYQPEHDVLSCWKCNFDCVTYLISSEFSVCNVELDIAL